MNVPEKKVDEDAVLKSEKLDYAHNMAIIFILDPNLKYSESDLEQEELCLVTYSKK